MSRLLDVFETEIGGLAAFRRRRLADSRGFLERIYCADELAPVIDQRKIVQINRTLTRNTGTLRGLHFQLPPHAEMKVVSCLRGSVFDVAVDLRRGSATYLAWHGRVLSAENGESLVVPEGFAHGFQALEADCEMLYLHTAAYQPGAEGGLDALDASIGIKWPVPVSERSPRDAALASAEGFEGICI